MYRMPRSPKKIPVILFSKVSLNINQMYGQITQYLNHHQVHNHKNILEDVLHLLLYFYDY